MKKALKNENFTLFANNCVAGTIYKDLGLKFNTPFIGLYLSHRDFILFCQNPKKYLSYPLVETRDSDHPWPVAKLGTLTIEFMHYKNFEIANSKWVDRCARINWEKIGHILVTTKGCEQEDIVKFSELPLKYSITLTNSTSRKIENSYALSGFNNHKFVGDVLKFKNRVSGKRHMYDFDFIKWINNITN